MAKETVREVLGALNREDTEALFKKYAVLINKRDVVTCDMAGRLLGADAVKYAIDVKIDVDGFKTSGKCWAPREIVFLYRTGFMEAVAYHNVSILTAGKD